jgi:hypothetical protein
VEVDQYSLDLVWHRLAEWRRAVELQHHRLHERALGLPLDDDEFISLSADGYLYVLAVHQVRQLAGRANDGRRAGSTALRDAIKSFDKAVPDASRIRHSYEHAWEYDTGKGRRRGAMTGSDRETGQVCRLGPGGLVVESVHVTYGEWKMDTATATAAALELADALASAVTSARPSA